MEILSEITATGGGRGSGPVFIFDLPKLLIPPNYLKTQCNTVQHSAKQCKLLTLQIIWKHSAALHHPPQCKLRSALFKTALLNIIKYHSTTVPQYHSISITVPLCHSITVSQYQYQYHSTTVSASVSQNHRLHCTKPLRHSKGAIWAKRTGFNFCWLPLTNSYQIPLLQALTTKVSKILPNPLCVQQQQKKHHLQALIKETQSWKSGRLPLAWTMVVKNSSCALLQII